MGRRQSFLDISYAVVIGGIALLAVLIIVSPVVIALMTSFTEGSAVLYWSESTPIASLPASEAASKTPPPEPPAAA